jgi:hypothetical protein
MHRGIIDLLCMDRNRDFVVMSSNPGLSRLQLCDLCVSVVFFVTCNVVTTSTKLTQMTQRLSPINPQPKSSNWGLPGLQNNFPAFVRSFQLKASNLSYRCKKFY